MGDYFKDQARISGGKGLGREQILDNELSLERPKSLCLDGGGNPLRMTPRTLDQIFHKFNNFHISLFWDLKMNFFILSGYA